MLVGSERLGGLRRSVSLLTTYISRALDRAVFDQLDDGSFVAEVPGLQGVLATGAVLEACRAELADVIEGWVLFRVANGMAVPAIDGATVDAHSVG